jgi:hypothetical protein
MTSSRPVTLTRDSIDSATEHALVGSDSTEHSRIEAIAFGTPNCDVVAT